MFKFLSRSFSTYNERKYDLVVVGGGIIGAAAAREILIRHPHLKLAMVEKEDQLAKHQSGHNSGVLYTGVYFTPGTLTAKLCFEGVTLLYKYLDTKNIPYKKVGKLIVATTDLEVDQLLELWVCAQQHRGYKADLIDTEEIKEHEPYCHGLKAIWSPDTGIVNFALVTEHFGEDVKEMSGEIHLNFKVDKFAYSFSDLDYPIHVIAADNQIIATKYALTCGGLYSDQLAALTGCSRNPKIIPIRGEYLLLDKIKCHMIKSNIYSVPDTRLPFSGVHITQRLDGSISMGPNAILALKREGYSWRHINIVESFDTLLYPGFIKLATKYMAYGIGDRSFWKAQQIKQLQKYVPQIHETDAYQGPAGVRAQALDENGNFIEDLIFDKSQADNVVAKRVLHCRNTPSPGASSSMAIAKIIADEVNTQFKLDLIDLK